MEVSAMSEIFDPVDQLLAACFPKIAAIDWTHFGGKLVPYDDSGVPKATGVLMHSTRKPITGINTRAYGFLPRPEKSAQIVVTKVRLLQDNPNAISSMELRNPEINHWGGGIRSSNNSDEIYAITGLPEIGDHLLLAQLMRACDLLTYRNWLFVADRESHHMVAAREFADMSIGRHMELNGHMFDIVQDGRAAIERAA